MLAAVDSTQCIDTNRCHRSTTLTNATSISACHTSQWWQIIPATLIVCSKTSLWRSSKNCKAAHTSNLTWNKINGEKMLHTHPFNGLFSGTTQVSRYQKNKTNLDFTEARDSEWQWYQLGHMQICKSAPCSRQTTIPAPYHSVFYRPDALPAAQPTASKQWRQKINATFSLYSISWVRTQWNKINVAKTIYFHVRCVDSINTLTSMSV